jgi:serine/threonine protein kinase
MQLGWVERSPHWAPVLGELYRFDVLGRVGSGGMAEVFLAREKDGPRRSIAIKRLFPVLAAEDDLRSMFVDEARLGMRLAHPSLCRVYDVGEIEGDLCIAMEYVEGVTLAELIDRHPNGVPREVALAIIADIASALATVHAARDEHGRPLGIVHRDVTPRNVMVGFDGRARLLDFGVAKSVLNEAITRPGMAKGKFGYLAPELWGEDVEADPRADVFSLGICLYEALTGQRLYHRVTPAESRAAIVDAPVPSIRAHLPRAPEALDRVVKRALAKTPNERFESASVMERVLVELMAALGDRNDATSAFVGSAFEAEHARGVTLEPTSFGASVRAPDPFERREVVQPALAAPTLPPVANEPSRGPWFVAAGVVLGVALATVGVWSLDDEAPRIEARVIEAPPVVAPIETPMPAALPAPIEPIEPAIVQAPAPEHVVQLDEVEIEIERPMGTLSVNTRPWSEVLVDGRSIGMTPIGNVRVAAGRHELTFVDGEGARTTRRIEVPADGEAQIFEDLRATPTVAEVDQALP